jgi:hypothetical protein
MSEVRLVPLPKGEVLELTIHPGFYDKVRQHFNLLPNQEVSDDHLRMFVFGALKGAIDKAEAGMKKDERPAQGTPRVRRTRRRKESPRG